MLLKQLKSVFKKLSVRLTLLYTTVLICCLGAGFLTLYFLMSTSLRGRDHDIIEAKAKEYLTLYEHLGIEGLKQNFEVKIGFNKDSNLFVRIFDENNQVVFIHFPSDADRFQISDELPKEGWSTAPAKGDEDLIESLTTQTHDHKILQVGKSTEYREGQLEQFQGFSGLVVAIFVGIGIIIGLLISNRALAPIRGLVSTIKDLQRGDASSRVKVNNTGDELDELSKLFNAMLEKNEKLIGGMRDSLDNISHDLKTPMTRFRCSAELALKNDVSTEVLKAGLVEAVEESDQILSILNTLLDLSEAQAQATLLRRDQFNLSQIAQEAVDLYEFVAEEKGIIIKMELTPDLIISGDPVRLRRAIANLLDNAIKYTPSGGTVMLKSYLESNFGAVTVIDTGVGIDHLELPHIWDRLYRGDQSRAQRGLGLGLSLVKAIVELHQGMVKVKSQPHHGSSFSIFLPL